MTLIGVFIQLILHACYYTQYSERLNTEQTKKLKVVYTSGFLMRIPSQSYGASPAIWDHTMLPVNVPRFNLSLTGRYSFYLPRRDGRLS